LPQLRAPHWIVGKGSRLMRRHLGQLPPGFLWGTATSSHQVEGGNANNDWSAWEQEAGRIRDGSRAGDAAGWWRGKAESDLALAAELGQNAHRLSVEWSRIEPEPGRYEEAALDRYMQILSAARDLGMKTMVTLHHFTLPRWVAARGGWLAGETAVRFSAFATRVAERLGTTTDLWATINEPNVLAMMAYGGRRWPPATGSLRACFRALLHLLRAHARAYAALHRTTPQIPVGLVFNMPLFEPARPAHPLDRFAARMQDWSFSGCALAAVRDGRLRPPLTWTARKIPGLAASFDWLGLNYYGRLAVRFDPRSRELGRHVQQPSVRTEWIDWGEPYPRGIPIQLRRLAALGRPVYVTENGVFDNTDTLRPRFLTEHIAAVVDAHAEGIDVRGYFHWTIVDNFEWTEGWSTRFGLIELDRETGARRLRESARVYAEICKKGKAP
jgi:beta-glucosidase